MSDVDLGHKYLRGNKLAWLVVVVVLAVACLLVSPLSMLLPNLGLPFGYYGKLNKVRDRLQSMSNVEIVGVRGNYDVTLEDFTFDLRIDGKHAVFGKVVKGEDVIILILASTAQAEASLHTPRPAETGRRGAST